MSEIHHEMRAWREHLRECRENNEKSDKSD